MNAMTPHILYVGSILPKRSETFVYREVLGLRDRGVRVSVASVHEPEAALAEPRLGALADEAIRVYGRGLRGKWRVVRDAPKIKLWRPTRGLFETRPMYWPKYMLQCEAGYALAQRVLHKGITHVHAHMAHVPTTVAMSCAEALGIPFSFTGHAADLFRDRSALRTKLERAAFVACISEWHREFYKQVAPGLDDAKLPVVRCGVDLDEFSVADPTQGRGILAVGRLVPKKGFDVLIRALGRAVEADGKPSGALSLRPAALGLRLTLVGDGPEEKALKALAEEVGVADRVDFVGAKSNDQVRELMGRAALFVLPCKQAADGDRDGIPVVLMEAMARGVCVVSGDLPTIRELVADNQCGVMVPPGSVDELSDVMVRLLGDTEDRQRLATAGRARVVEEFSLDVNLDRLQAAFSRAAEPQDAAQGNATPSGAAAHA